MMVANSINTFVWHLDVGSSHPRVEGKILRVRLFSDIKVVRELGSERRETVRSLSTIHIISDIIIDSSTRGLKNINQLFSNCLII